MVRDFFPLLGSSPVPLRGRARDAGVNYLCGCTDPCGIRSFNR